VLVVSTVTVYCVHVPDEVHSPRIRHESPEDGAALVVVLRKWYQFVDDVRYATVGAVPPLIFNLIA
jgi:hypothetical protein